jgi:hypothetical protein
MVKFSPGGISRPDFSNRNREESVKQLFAIFVFLMAVTSVYSLAPTDAVIDGGYEVACDTIIKATGPFDTLSGATDSVTVFTKNLNYRGEGWQYILVRDAITGGGSDSVKIAVVLDALDGNNNLFYRTVVDSFTASTGEAVRLPIGGTVIGTKYRVKFLTYTDNGGVVILNRIYLFKRRVNVKSVPDGK